MDVGSLSTSWVLRVATACLTLALAGALPVAGEESESDAAKAESRLLQAIRQVTFAGKRAGESYFSRDGSRMVFQSEREEDNPFYQIYLMDLETGDLERISPGHGKTTCAWIHPDGKRVLYASTHHDPEARAKQKAELDFRASGKQRRYSWDYDENYELYFADGQGNQLTRLTHARGYDAEGSVSPDGSKIVFASNRHAYSQELSEKDAELFKVNKSFLMDIYIMDADGSNVQRLTHARGYDGGPFFSSDGRKITWRRFSEDGTTAEIYSMDLDGSNQRRLTHLNAMSWAPFFHPSGDYLIFATNKHGFANFELYLVDAEGQRDPVRVTYTQGFDGLPVFAPDGKRLAWTSNRGAEGNSQVFFADWNGDAALELLGLGGRESSRPPVEFARASLPSTAPRVRAEDMRAHVSNLASGDMAGRLTGSDGEKLAAAYIATHFEALGLLPAGRNDSYFQDFRFTSNVTLGTGNRLRLQGDGESQEFQADKEWRPIAFSRTGAIEASDVVFAGYGIAAPAVDGQDEYDSYVHLDVTDKWVMLLRFLPEEVDEGKRRQLVRYASLRFKAMTARDKGAKGIIVVQGPNSKSRQQLEPLTFDASMAGSSVGAISVTDEVAARLLKSSGKNLKQLQTELDSGKPAMGFPIPGIQLAAQIDLFKHKGVGRNVLARLPAGTSPGSVSIVVGAHFDHLGRGETSSLARSDEKGQVHHGADDNASGTAGVLEIAEFLSHQKAQGRLQLERDVVFALWSGEELGLLGSKYFVDHYAEDPKAVDLKPAISAYLNMDMIGRLREKVTLQGVGSSSIWPDVIERRNVPVGLSVVTQDDAYLPTDATSFYLRKVPVLSAFTGVHEDYHSPRDTFEKINYDGAAKVARLMGLVARDLAIRSEAPDYVSMKAPDRGQRAGLRIYLGTIPDYTPADIPGLKLSGVSKDGPAEKAGIRGGDVIVELAGKKIENIYDYTYAIDALKIGRTSKVVIVREGKRIELEITPASRQ